MQNKKILVIEKEWEDFEDLGSQLFDLGIDMDCAGSLDDGVTAIQQRQYDCFVLDYEVAKLSDYLIPRKILEFDHNALMIFCFTDIQNKGREDIQRFRPFEVIDLPINKEDILYVVSDALMERDEV